MGEGQQQVEELEAVKLEEGSVKRRRAVFRSGFSLLLPINHL